MQSGAIGASFYLPAMQTEDLDIFVFLPASSGPLVTLGPVYDALKTHGGEIEGAYVRFGKWPVQILTDANALIAEAIREAVGTDYDGVPTWVFTAKHLCGIALHTGRAKDFARVMLFIEENEVEIGGFRRWPPASGSLTGWRACSRAPMEVQNDGRCPEDRC